MSSARSSASTLGSFSTNSLSTTQTQTTYEGEEEPVPEPPVCPPKPLLLDGDPECRLLYFPEAAKRFYIYPFYSVKDGEDCLRKVLAMGAMTGAAGW
jgi:hypothetical protein